MRRLLVAAGVAAALAGSRVPGPGPRAGAADPAPSPAQVKPRWKPGDRWVVQSASQILQARDEDAGGKTEVEWQFTVEPAEKVDGADCHRVRVECLLPGAPRPETVIWVDAATYALKQIEAQLPVRGEFRAVREKFAHDQARPSPVFVPLSVVPLDLPAFVDDAKSVDFGYTATQPPRPGEKAAGDVGFRFRVTQRAAAPDAAFAKSVLPAAYAKGLGDRPTVRFDLAAPGHAVTQVWQQGEPWAVYQTNGQTESRLKSFTPAK